MVRLDVLDKVLMGLYYLLYVVLGAGMGFGTFSVIAAVFYNEDDIEENPKRWGACALVAMVVGALLGHYLFFRWAV